MRRASPFAFLAVLAACGSRSAAPAAPTRAVDVRATTPSASAPAPAPAQGAAAASPRQPALDDASFLAEADRRLAACVVQVDATARGHMSMLRAGDVSSCLGLEAWPRFVAGHEDAILSWVELPAGRGDRDDLRRYVGLNALAGNETDPSPAAIRRLFAVARAYVPPSGPPSGESLIAERLAAAVVHVYAERAGLFDELVDLVDHHPSLAFRAQLLQPFAHWAVDPSVARVRVLARYAALEDGSMLQRVAIGGLALERVPPSTEAAACAALERELESPVVDIPLLAANEMGWACPERREALVAWLEKVEPRLGPSWGTLSLLTLCEKAGPQKPRVVALAERIAQTPAHGKPMRVGALQALSMCMGPSFPFLTRYQHDPDPEIRRAAYFHPIVD